MSWWDIDNKRDVIGDRPADIIGDTLTSIALIRRREGRRLPTLQETADAVAVALARSPKAFSDDNGQTPSPRVVIALSSGAAIASRDEAVADEAMVTAFVQAFAAMSRAYVERWGRRPRHREALYTIKFVLRADPGAYVADAPDDGVTIQGVMADGATRTHPSLGRELSSTSIA